MKADLILFNGSVFSVDGADKIHRAEAVIVKDGKILALCASSEIKPYISEHTEVIDCKGNTILPGICDGHCHPGWAASFFEACQLFDIIGAPQDTSREVMQRYLERLSEYVQASQQASIIRGAGWNRAFFAGACKEARWPTRHDLDRICSDKPVVLESYCQHVLWVNTKAIELAGLSEKTEEPESGVIFREANGYPSGLFFEMEAQRLIKDRLPGYDYSVEQYKQTIRRYQRELANPYGVTLIQDCLHTENAKTAYKELAKAGELTMRVRGVYHLDNLCDPDAIDGIAARKGMDNVNDTFEINTIKIFLEGEFTMIEPYETKVLKEQGLPKDYGGVLFYDDQTVKKAVVRAVETGMQIHIHAMGDRAVKQAVESLVYAQNKTHTKNRNVIAHLMAVGEEEIKAMGRNQILCNCQPRWMVYDSDAAEYYSSYFGRSRTLNFYPNQRLLDAGCMVAYGTDFPVTPPPNPFHGIQCAVTRSVFPDGTDEFARYKGTVLGPDNAPRQDCVSLANAIKSSTYSVAWQLFLEKVTGSIEPGKSAELVILDCNIEQVEQDELYKIGVERTIFKGKSVYIRERKERVFE